jgi:hypothetical protein
VDCQRMLSNEYDGTFVNSSIKRPDHNSQAAYLRESRAVCATLP